MRESLFFGFCLKMLRNFFYSFNAVVVINFVLLLSMCLCFCLYRHNNSLFIRIKLRFKLIKCPYFSLSFFLIVCIESFSIGHTNRMGDNEPIAELMIRWCKLIFSIICTYTLNYFFHPVDFFFEL